MSTAVGTLLADHLDLALAGPGFLGGGAVGAFGPETGPALVGVVAVRRHRQQAPLALLVHQPVAVVGGLGHEWAVRTVRVRNATPGGGVTFQPTLIPWIPSS